MANAANSLLYYSLQDEYPELSSGEIMELMEQRQAVEGELTVVSPPPELLVTSRQWWPCWDCSSDVKSQPIKAGPTLLAQRVLVPLNGRTDQQPSSACSLKTSEPSSSSDIAASEAYDDAADDTDGATWPMDVKFGSVTLNPAQPAQNLPSGARSPTENSNSSEDSNMNVSMSEAASDRSTATVTTRSQARVEADKARQLAELHYKARHMYNQIMQQPEVDQNDIAELRNRARVHSRKARHYRQLANEAAFRAHNTGIVNEITVDLHGMHVDEAVQVLTRYLWCLNQLNSPEVVLRVITGAGKHSVNGEARIRNSVMEFLANKGFDAELDAENSGLVIVKITGKMWALTTMANLGQSMIR